MVEPIQPRKETPHVHTNSVDGIPSHTPPRNPHDLHAIHHASYIVQSSYPHCVGEATPLRSASDATDALAKHIGCFQTFAEAIYIATGGTVVLDGTVTPETLTEAMLAPAATASSVVIGVDYGAIEFNTGHGSYTWTGSQGPCSPTLSYGVASMPSSWNDAVSSARSYSDCNKYKHFEHTWSGGTSITCDQGNTCRLMGYMDNRTSSETWSY